MSEVKLEPIGSQERLYAKVARRIAELIDRGDVSAGEKLPSERDLAEMLQVSRPTVREAMIALEVSGIIEVRTGSGIYVSDKKSNAPSFSDAGVGPFDILEMRSLVEPEACALAAQRITSEQLDRLSALFAEMEEKKGTPEMEAVDRRFHELIAESTENAAIANTVNWLWELRSQSGLSAGFHRLIIEEGVFPALEEHRAILEALRRGDAGGSREAMRQHLEAATAAAATHFEDRG